MTANLLDLKISEFDGTLKSWKKVKPEVAQKAASNEPVLFQPDGGVYGLRRDHSQLPNLQLQSGALYLVGPHGEIINVVAAAIRQKLLGASANRMLHIDAHLDSLNDGLSLRTLFQAFLENGMVESFQALSVEAKDSVETFIHAMAPHFSSITGVFREEYSPYRPKDPVNCYSVSKYFYEHVPEDRVTTLGLKKSEGDDLGTIPLSLLDKELKGDLPTVWSIDADFCGVVREREDWRTIALFQERMQQVLTCLNHVLDQGRTSSTLFTLSLDPNFVAHPMLFLDRFMTEFYGPRIVVNKLTQV